ncbi:MAE_28990/MAE_18760 family HEPN-like nuclease [Pseudomonas aeruginosa]
MSFDCVEELEVKVSEIQLVAKLADTMLEGSEIGEVLGELADASPRREAANTMTKAALVLLTGYFEGFLKKLIEEFVGEINDLNLSLNNVGDELLLSILQYSITDNRNKTLDKALGLKACFVGNAYYPLVQDAIGGTKGNPTVDTIETMFQRVGIPEIIDKLSIADFGLDSTYAAVSQSQPLRAQISSALAGDLVSSEKILEIIDRKWLPKRQRRNVGYVGVIQELLKRRNRIAHGENWGEQVTPQELDDCCIQVLKLCTGIASSLYAELSTYRLATA